MRSAEAVRQHVSPSRSRGHASPEAVSNDSYRFMQLSADMPWTSTQEGRNALRTFALGSAVRRSRPEKQLRSAKGNCAEKEGQQIVNAAEDHERANDHRSWQR